MADTTGSRLLALQDHCLLAVMQCCAADASTVLTAATAHSRLQRAAVEALSSISKGLEDQQAGSLLLYLAKHGQHVCSLALCAPDYAVQLRELPPTLTKLDSLQLEGLRLQLQPDVLRAGLPLTRLELSRCTLLDRAQGLTTALVQLPDLQHLSICELVEGCNRARFLTAMLSHLTKLTMLKFEGLIKDGSSRDPSAVLQPLQALTRLADLQLGPTHTRTTHRVTADSLSGADQLTRLVLSEELFEPCALAGKSQLQHLTLERCSFVPGTGLAQLLSELQHLTQLTHLDLNDSCWWWDREESGPPLTAFAGLTASSKLQRLDFSRNTLPSAAWQYLCPPGRTLPQLQDLNLTDVTEANGYLALPDTSALLPRPADTDNQHALQHSAAGATAASDWLAAAVSGCWL